MLMPQPSSAAPAHHRSWNIPPGMASKPRSAILPFGVRSLSPSSPSMIVKLMLLPVTCDGTTYQCGTRLLIVVPNFHHCAVGGSGFGYSTVNPTAPEVPQFSALNANAP